MRLHRRLGSSARDQGGKDNPEWVFLAGIGCASEHESEGAAGALDSCGDAGVGRLEAEAVPSFDGALVLANAKEADRDALFRKLLAYGAVVAIVAAPLVWLVFVVLGIGS